MPFPLELADFGLSHDPKQPSLSALREAFAQNMCALAASVEQALRLASGPRRLGKAEMKKRMEDFVRLAKHAKELSQWVYQKKAMTRDAAVRVADLFLSIDNEWAAEMRHSLEKLAVGRPPARRQAHMKAFDFMLQSNRNSLGIAMTRFCPCGGEVHDVKCRQRFKTGLRSLKRVLRKHAPHLVAKYDVLHPNRYAK